MRKADLVASISDKTGVPKVDVLVSLETFFKEVKSSLASGENVYVRGFGSFIIKKRAKKVGRHIKKNVAIEIPEHYIPAFKPAKIFIDQVKDNVSELPEDLSDKEEKKSSNTASATPPQANPASENPAENTANTIADAAPTTNINPTNPQV